MPIRAHQLLLQGICSHSPLLFWDVKAGGRASVGA
jgi:hypothetical protein